MRTPCASLLTVVAALGVVPSTALARPVSPINAVVGDASWIERFGRAPTAEDARLRDDARHRVHLAWIERRLREKPVDHLDAARRETRARLLDALADYRRRGVHPRNDLPVRRPRFLDPQGRICAVGYLIEITAGRDVVERVNARWEYDDLLEIEDPELDAWIASSGLTKQELASIQPTGYAGPSLDFGDGDAWLAGLGAALLFAGNVATTAIAIDELRREPRSRRAQLGAGQLALGVLQLVACAVTLGLGAGGRVSEDYRDPVVGSSIALGLFATFHLVAGGVQISTAGAGPPGLR